MKAKKKIIVAVVLILIAIQFVPVKENISDIIPSTDMLKMLDAPENVATIFKESCYNCHSNNTNYPWYSQISPVSLFVDHHIAEGKDELDFSDFGNYSTKRKSKKLREIVEEIEDDKMPLTSYLVMHGEAKLSEEEKTIIIDWVTKVKSSL
ncbi:MAG: heme-binding domain-containing protein [Flavobacteriaceae bacterium]|nr:heme-binding domain-containing protein [Flavobacteriaceae bacterium]